MSVLNFFKSKSKVSEIPEIQKNIFLDEIEPELIKCKDSQVSLIDKFLNKNFEEIGNYDGYSFPENEYLKSKLKCMKADFRHAVDKQLDQLRSNISELNIHLIKIKGISEKLENQINEKLKQYQSIVEELEMQKILSIEEEGFISSSICAYRVGFIKGIEKYQMDKLFSGNVGLFNY